MLATQETKIGITVNKLRSSSEKAVSELVKEIVKKWKADVGQPATKKHDPSNSKYSLSLSARMLFRS